MTTSQERIQQKWLKKNTQKGVQVKPVGGDRVTVAVRVRPLLMNTKGSPDGEGAMTKAAIIGNTAINAVETSDGKTRKKDYPFDYVFTQDQHEIYDCMGKDMLVDAFSGYNVCLFAYGQTGSGKTYTVQGVPGAGLPADARYDPDQEGILPRLIRDLFNIIEEMLEDDSSLNVKVTMSLTEVYNEKVRDLLPVTPLPRGTEAPSLEIVQGAKGIEVVGLAHHTVIGCDRVIQLLAQGNRNRQVAETKMNECSSRSHTITQLHVVQRHDPPTPETKDCESLITIVDLAGSERQSKTDAQGAEFTQAKYINHSLLQLGRALNSFSGKTGGAKHVPLRDSKLTRLLSESFGGNSKTWMLATVSPSLYNWSESLSTLSYASNAKFITNNAKQNRLERAMEMKELKESNADLEDRLELMRRKTEALQRQVHTLQDECDNLRKHGDPSQLMSLKNALTSELDQLRNEEPPPPPKAEWQDQWSLGVPASKTYIGRAKVSLKNIIEQRSQYFNLPLTSTTPKSDNAFLKVKIYPVDAKVCTRTPVHMRTHPHPHRTGSAREHTEHGQR